MDETPEKRSDRRVPLILRVEYPGHERVLRDTTENLSAGGLFIRSDRELPIGERIPLQISFPGLLPPLTVEVEVVRCRESGPAGPRGLAVRVPQDRPDDRAALAALTSAALGVEAAPPAGYRILVVEDNHYVVGMYEYALRKLGGPEGLIELRFAANGHEALESLQQSRPELLITDLYMPVMDGFTLLERLRADPGLPKVAVLVISAGDEAARERALALGVDVFLRKPVQFADLVGTVSSLLGLRARGAPRP